MTSFDAKGIGACLTSTLILFLSGAGLASEEGDASSSKGLASEKDDASSSKGLASILFEGTSETATYSIDGKALTIPYVQPATQPLVIKAGRHVIEVHEGKNLVLREEVVLEPGETKTLRVMKAEPK